MNGFVMPVYSIRLSFKRRDNLGVKYYPNLCDVIYGRSCTFCTNNKQILIKKLYDKSEKRCQNSKACV